MLNISPNSIRDKVDKSGYSSFQKVEGRNKGRRLLRFTLSFFLGAFLILFLPWTQNIRSAGQITTLKPDQRPQTVHSIIDGRIERWYVQEGDFVEKGDTILFISEIKDEYFDPNLLQRTNEQLNAKKSSVESYEEKIKALDLQISNLKQTNVLKQEQARNKVRQMNLKVTSDSIDYQAKIINYNIALEQFQRMEKLYNDGLKSLTQYENRNLTLQKAQADMVAGENKLLTSKNELINAKVELNSIEVQYQDKIAKATSDKYSAFSNKFDAEGTMTKLENQLMNYTVRTSMHYITSPQQGYVTQAIQTGIGETIKSGAEIVSIMPAKYDLAVEMYVKPLDLPLIEKGQHVRIQFDGWPAIVFSGWPNTSYGTYGGTVFAIDNFISTNGKYRLLVAPDINDHEWPTALRVGTGTNSLVLLKDVPIWYELWRQINGFPPDYYKTETTTQLTKADKK